MISQYIDRPAVAVIASGESSNWLTEEEKDALRTHTTIIALNFRNVVTPHIRYWRDINVSRWMAKQPKPWPILISRHFAFGNKHLILPEVKDLYDATIKIESNYDLVYTAYHIINLLKESYKGKVLLIGYDFSDKYQHSEYSANGEQPTKREDHEGQKNHLRDLPLVLEAEYYMRPWDFINFFNCSPITRLNGIKKSSITEALGA